MTLPVALFPSFPFQHPQLLAYYELLKNVDSKEQLFSALAEVIKTSTFFPTVAAILEVIAKQKVIYPASHIEMKELANPGAVPMPEQVKVLREFLRSGLPGLNSPQKSPAPISDTFPLPAENLTG